MSRVNLTRAVVAGVLALLLAGTALAAACARPAPTPSPSPAPAPGKAPAPAPKATAAPPAKTQPATSRASPAPKPTSPSAWAPPKLIMFSAPNITSAAFLSTQAMVAVIGKKTGVAFKLQPEAVGMTRFSLVKKGDVHFSTMAGTEHGEAWNGGVAYDSKRGGDRSRYAPCGSGSRHMSA